MRGVQDARPVGVALSRRNEMFIRSAAAAALCAGLPAVAGAQYGPTPARPAAQVQTVEWFRANPLIREELKQGCQGFVLDSQTGKVRRVDV